VFKNHSSIGTNDTNAQMTLSQGFGDPVRLASVKGFDPRTGILKPMCQTQRGINCVRNYALHEFGHAAGLRHERERVENNCHLGSPPVDHEEHWKTATQIGDFDEESIMNYCQNYEDMIADVEPRLSDRDVATLKALYEMPIAKIAGELIMTSAAQYRLNLRVLGQRAKLYRYKYGVSETLNCDAPEGYSEPRGVQTPITDLLDKSLFGKRIKVCVLGGDGQTWQQAPVYSSVSYALR
jgi:hypothetical protein